MADNLGRYVVKTRIKGELYKGSDGEVRWRTEETYGPFRLYETAEQCVLRLTQQERIRGATIEELQGDT